ncbi:flagellar FliJ family protein [Deferribacterales bacterium Es71-Z0220]|uniref:flagellar export protein FliJ n=1 Tax=Deferrivibrio essentukiensis TaxID=2880922 RepID=UPI001F61BBD9|nr:flagellar FliJ family protein [Deferrivibrio essentukiensis]MCB4203745.1 flagellar FliJ family protein [Deferrivibrio essentukiensis]
MKKDFKLQKVLEYRERKLELEKKKLTELQNKLKEANFGIEKILSDINKNIIEMKDARNFQFIKMYELYIEKLEKELEELKGLKKRLESDIEKQKKSVVNAMNDVKVIEKLKDKHIKNYLMYLNKEEMKMIDELVVTRFNNENF